MAQFDPRRRPVRFAPPVLLTLAAVVTVALTWRVFQPAHAASFSEQPLDPTALAALEARAFETAGAPQGLDLPRKVSVKLSGGESVDTAIRRLGVGEQDASAASRALSAAGLHSVSGFDAAIASPREGSGPVRLIGLSTRTGPATTLTPWRAPSTARVGIGRALEEKRLRVRRRSRTARSRARCSNPRLRSAQPRRR